MKLRATQVALIGVALLAVALAGVPLLLRTPQGSLRGVVVDGRGFGVADAAVFLFAESPPHLREETHTDDEGNFSFHLDSEPLRVFVKAPEERGLLPAFGPPADERMQTLALVLQPARALTVSVRDPRGSPVVGAEVRVYEERLEAAVLARAETDARGRATLVAPARAHVAVYAPGPARLARWRFDLAVPLEGVEIDFTLPPAQLVGGSVQDTEGGALEGVLVVAWEEGLEGGWNGFTFSDSEGHFELACSAAPSVARAVDPQGLFLPQRQRFLVPSAAALEFRLARGAPQVVRTARAGLPIGTRVWSWSPAAEAWGFGVRTNSTGRATVPVAARFAIRAEPLDPAFEPLEAWDVASAVGTLQLEASPTP